VQLDAKTKSILEKEDLLEKELEEALNNPNLDEKQGKKLKQMIRNRISA